MVLCPVVDRTPARKLVLYRGQIYLGSSSGNCKTGFTCVTGSDGCISPIFASTKILNLKSHLPASIDKPCIRTPSSGSSKFLYASKTYWK